MKIRQAFYKAQLAIRERKAETVKFLAVESALTLMCLVPLLFLTENGLLMYLSALSLPMWLLIKVPARLNAAAAMQDRLDGGTVFSLRLADFGDYGKKVLYGVKRLGLLILWSAPMIAALVYAWDKYAGDTDSLTVMQMIYDFGGQDMKTGVIYLLLVFAGLLLLVLLGMGFHSGDRHAYVLAEKDLLKGKRQNVLLCRICSLICLIPLIIAFVITAFRYAPLLNDVSNVLSGNAELPSTKISLIILGIGAVLTLPMIPMRSMVMTAFVRGIKDQQVN